MHQPSCTNRNCPVRNKVFLSYQPCQLVKSYQRFGDHLCSHRQGIVVLRFLKVCFCFSSGCRGRHHFYAKMVLRTNEFCRALNYIHSTSTIIGAKCA